MKKVFLMLAVVAMASCSKSELTTRPEVAGDVEIMAGSSVLSIDTKAPYTGTTITSSAPVVALVYAVESDATAYGDNDVWAHGYMAFNDSNVAVGFKKWNSTSNSLTDNDAKYYPADDKALVLSAFAPVTPGETSEIWTNGADANAGTFTAVIDGKTDLMFAQAKNMWNKTGGSDGKGAEYQNSDNKPINKENAKTLNPNFVFKHLLTLVKIKVQAVDDEGNASEAVAKTWGEIEGIELTQVLKDGSLKAIDDKMTVKLADGTSDPANSGTANRSTKFYMCDNSGTATAYTDDLVGSKYTPTGETSEKTRTIAITPTVDKVVAYAMIAPFKTGDPTDGSVKNMELKIKTTKGHVTTTVPVFVLKKGTTGVDKETDTEGKEFTLTLKFKGQEIKATASVAEWDDETISGSDVDVM